MRGCFLLLALVLAGCQAELSADLDEAQADAILLALDEAGIGAQRERTDANRTPARYRVVVPRGDVPGALAVLRARDLPRAREPGFEALFEGSSLVPSAAEERARHAAALAGELSRSIEAMDGVERARVHLALGDDAGRPLDDVAAPARASVLVTVRDGAAVDEDAVRTLVAGAVPHLAPADVALVTSPAPSAAPREPRMTWVGPIAVSRGSATTLKLVVGGSLALNLLLALALLLWRRRSTTERDVVERGTSDAIRERRG